MSMTPFDPLEPRNDDPLDAQWPGEPGDESLRQFARRFDAARPTLPPEALERVREGLCAEIRRVDRRRRAWLALTRGSLAASLLLALGGLFYATRDKRPVDRQPIVAQPANPPAIIEDQLRVAMDWPAAASIPAGPLLPLDNYRSLIEETH